MNDTLKTIIDDVVEEHILDALQPYGEDVVLTLEDY